MSGVSDERAVGGTPTVTGESSGLASVLHRPMEEVARSYDAPIPPSVIRRPKET
ncbi:hypothetical protein K239x_57660 [Planctomycetes bacterium K23_9]|uniref:Uncharacterized protein n=1 Tax=Stieleria marina TaxID=1930275 RepID=A0A517P2Z7_9BACT|nr:hypothetical protein K239x_57660 [Planctomycetes bacterium K23_9]